MLVRLDVVVRDRDGPVSAGTAVTVKKLDGTNASLFTDATGVTPLLQPVATDADGRLPGFVELGSYTLNYSGKVVAYEAVSGRMSVGNEYLALTGVAATDTPALQRAEDALSARGGGEVLLAGGLGLVDGSLGNPACLIERDNVRMIGQGRDITTLKRANGSNKDLIVSDRYGAGGANGGTKKAGFESMSIDGNRANNSGAYGLKLDTTDPRLADLAVFAFARPIWCTKSRNDPYPADTDDGYVRGLRVHDFTEEGIRWDGPHDTQGHDIWVWSDFGIGFICNNVSVWDRIHSWGLAENMLIDANGGGSKFTECVLEGAGTVNGQSGYKLRILTSYINFQGELFAAGGNDSLRGVQIGDATHTVAYTLLDITTRGLTNGILFWKNATNDKGRFKIHAQESSGKVINGSETGAGFFDPSQLNDFRQCVAVNGMTLCASGHTPLDTLNSAATLTLPQRGGDQTIKVWGTTTVTNINILPAGSRVTLFSGDNPGVGYTDGGNLKLAGNFATANFNDSITLVSDGTNWIETARSHN